MSLEAYYVLFKRGAKPRLKPLSVCISLGNPCNNGIKSESFSNETEDIVYTHVHSVGSGYKSIVLLDCALISSS